MSNQEQRDKKRYATYPIIINDNSLVQSPYNNRFRYQFPTGTVEFKDAQVAVSKIALYYSWFNITSENNNNTFSFIWDGALTVQHDLTLDDGFYDVAAVNAFLQDYCVDNSLYLIDANGDYVYYLEFVENVVYYAVQFNSYPIPTALPTGWSEPAGWPGYPVSASTPQLIIPAITDSTFGNIVGFNTGTTPALAQATNYSKLSDFTPQVSIVQSLILTCTLLNNQYSIPNTALYTFSPNVSFGALIISEPTEHEFIDIQSGRYAYLEIEFLDQSFNPIYIRDTNLIVQLMVKSELIDY